MNAGEMCSTALARLHLALSGRALPERSANDGQASLLAFMVAVLAFGFELTNPTLGVDDYLHLGKDFSFSEPFWVGRGMWGGLLVQYLVPGGWITPFITLILGILLQLLTAVLLGWVLHLELPSVRGRALLYSLFVTFPYFAEQMAFSYLQIGYPLAALFGVLGVFMASSCDRLSLRTGIASLFIACGVSVYQGSLSVILTVAAVAVISSFLSKRGTAHDTGRLLLRSGVSVSTAVVGGMASYVLAHKLVLAFSGIEAPSGYYTVSLQLAFWHRWADIHRCMSYLLLGCGGMIPPHAAVLFLLGAGLAVYEGSRHRPKPAVLAAGFLLAVAVLVAPFAVLFMHDGILTPRSSVGVAVMWFVAFAYSVCSRSRWIRNIGTTIGVIAVATFVFQDNRMFYSQHLVSQADRIMMSRIAERIDAGHGNRLDRPVVVVIGSYSHPPHPAMPRYQDSVLGFSQFEWDGGNVYRMQALAASVGVDRYDWRSADTLGPSAEIERIVRDRQPWPAAESVFVRDNRSVLWLGASRGEPRNIPLLTWISSLLGSTSDQGALSGGSMGDCESSTQAPSDVRKTLKVEFEGKATLIGLTAERLSKTQLRVSYYWWVMSDVPRMVFVHFTDRDGNSLYQNDHPFCRARPVSQLKGTFVKETFVVDVPPRSRDIAVDVRLGFYDPATSRRLKITSAEAASLDDGDTRAKVGHIGP